LFSLQLNYSGLKRFLLVLFLSSSTLLAISQAGFSVATDISVMRNFSPRQKFWAIGQTVIGEIHFSKKESAFARLTYFSPGRFSNTFTATAHSPSTVPFTMPYKVKGRWDNREVSIGWKHYLKGGFDEEVNWNLYSAAGFGLMFTEAENVFEPEVDTSLYNIASTPTKGVHGFKRLTIDLALGLEYPVGGGFFIYSEAKTWIAASDYPSPVLHQNRNVPLPLMLGLGLRILFNVGY
jgi:hypothetical protein